MKTEDIIYRVNRGYTMSIYGSSQAIHEEMLKDITFLLENNKQLILSGVGSSLPDLAECNQASLDYATKKNNPDFFLIKQTFKDGVNWALNYVTRPK